MHPLVYLAQHDRLETERLLLRPMQLSDLADYYELTSDDAHLQYAFFSHHTLDEALEGLVLYNLHQPLGRYGLELKETGKLIGNIAFRFGDQAHQVAIGYTLHPDFQGCGLMTEAARALCELAQEMPGIELVTAQTDARNQASQRLLERIGFQKVAERLDTSLRGEPIVSYDYEMRVKG